MDKFVLKILPQGLFKMIFYKKITTNHVIDFKKSYIYMGTYIVETQIFMEEQNSLSNENESSIIDFSLIRKL